MAIQSFEEVTSRKVQAGVRATRSWIIRGTSDQSQAISTLQSIASGNFQSLARDTVTVEPLYADANASGGVWRGIAEYRVFVRPVPAASGDSFYNFDTGGGSQHVTQSLGTMNSYAPTGGTAATGHGAINTRWNNGSPTVDGVDIIAPEYKFSETHYFADENITAAYKGIVFGLTGKMNNASFKGTDAGECLFLGASGQKRGSADWEITFNFGALPNKTNIAVGDITVGTKLGWDYMWVEYEADVSQTSLVQKPKNVHVERVYEFGDFSTLNIGT
jgi:hypothetical protein